MLTVSIGADMVLRKGMTRFWITGLTATFSQEYGEKKICVLPLYIQVSCKELKLTGLRLLSTR